MSKYDFGTDTEYVNPKYNSEPNNIKLIPINIPQQQNGVSIPVQNYQAEIYLSELLGEGGMAKVYLGFDNTQQKGIAVKCYNLDELNLDPNFDINKVYNEYGIMHALNQRFGNEYTPTTYGLFSACIDGSLNLCVAMEIAEGNLAEDIVILSYSDIAKFTNNVCKFFSNPFFTDTDIVHTDFKPWNIMRREDSSSMIIDWFNFLGKLNPNDSDVLEDEKENPISGTLAYSPIEYLAQTEKVLPQLAIQDSVGKSLIYILTGNHPTYSDHRLFRFPGNELTNPYNIPQNIFEVLDKATQFATRDRYPDLRSFATDFITNYLSELQNGYNPKSLPQEQLDDEILKIKDQLALAEA